MAYLHGPHHGLLDAEAHLLQVYEQLVEEVQQSPDSLAGQITLDPIGLNPKNPKLIPDEIGGMADEFLDQSGWTHVAGNAQDPHAELVREQNGVLRINCRECVSFLSRPPSARCTEHGESVAAAIGPIWPSSAVPRKPCARFCWSSNSRHLRAVQSSIELTAIFGQRYVAPGLSIASVA